MMHPLLEGLITASVPLMTAVIGYIAFLRKRTQMDDERQEGLVNLLMGLSQTQIIYLGMKYIERGWVTTEEYQDLCRYLWTPYCNLGGNGTAERIMHAVERLPFKSVDPSLMEVAWRTTPIRASDPTGLPLTDKDIVPYEGPDRRE